jgi:hypothetical protein
MDSPPNIDEVRRLPGVVGAEWNEPPRKAFFIGVQPPEELRSVHMLFVNGLYLIETLDEPGSWWMGQEGADGVINVGGTMGRWNRPSWRSSEGKFHEPQRCSLTAAVYAQGAFSASLHRIRTHAGRHARGHRLRAPGECTLGHARSA